MSDKILFSVIIPAFNAAATIEASVRSCLNQSYPPFEIIVVDDGSTDITRSLLENEFGDRIQLISLSENCGPSIARNTGINLATGSHIAFQDADDIWHPEKLFYVAKVLHEQPSIQFLFHPYTLGVLPERIEPEMVAAKRYPFWKLLLSNPIGTPCAIIRKNSELYFSAKLHYMEDYELFLREARAHKVYQISAAFTQIGRPILSAGGQSSNRWRMRKGELKAWWLFACKHPLYFPVFVPLMVFALLKHLVKSFFPPRANY